MDQIRVIVDKPKSIRVRRDDVAAVRVRALLQFPASVLGSGPVSVSKNLGTYTIGLDVQDITAQVPDPSAFSTDYVLVWDSVAKTYVRVSLAALGNIPASALEFTFDGGNGPLAAGSVLSLEIPFNCNVTKWRMFGDQAGSLVIDVRKCTAAQYAPPTHPAAADSIAGSDIPTLSSAAINTSSALTGWTVALNQGDILAAYIASVSTITKATLSLTVERR